MAWGIVENPQALTSIVQLIWMILRALAAIAAGVALGLWLGQVVNR